MNTLTTLIESEKKQANSYLSKHRTKHNKLQNINPKKSMANLTPTKMSFKTQQCSKLFADNDWT